MLRFNENWIKGYVGEYSVSVEGIVYSHNYMNTGRKHPLVSSPNNSGYCRVSLSKDGIVREFKVHRLVMESFSVVNVNKPLINHKDGDKLNNKLSNLEWCTPIENIHHAWETGLSTSRHSGARRRILQYKNGILIGKFIGVMDASRQTSIDPSSISRVCKGKQSHAGGYDWKYKEVGCQ